MRLSLCSNSIAKVLLTAACDLNSANHAKGTVSNGNEPFGDDWYATPAIEPIKRDRDSRGMLHAKGPGRISPSMDLSASLPPEGDFGEAVPNHALSRLPESRTTSPPSQLPNRNVTVHRSAILTMGNSRPIAVQGTRTATNDLSFNRPSCLKPETIAPANDSTRPLFRKISRDDEAGPSKKTSSKSSPKPTTSSRGSSETKSVPAPTIDSTSGMSKKAEKATKRKAEKATKRKSEKATKREAKRAQRLLNQILDDSAGTSNHSANVVAEGDQPAGNANALSPLSSKETAPGEAKILEAQKWMSASVSSEHTKAASTSPGNKRHSSGVPSQSEPPAEQVPGAGSSSTPDITVGDDPSLNLEAGCRVPGVTQL